jgi:hypothetical protein
VNSVRLRAVSWRMAVSIAKFRSVTGCVRFSAAQTMTDRTIADQLKALVDDSSLSKTLKPSDDFSPQDNATPDADLSEVRGGDGLLVAICRICI